MSDYDARMAEVAIADAARYAARRQAEDIALGLIPDTDTPRYRHEPKRGVKRSGHYGASARRVRNRAHGAACLPPSPQAAEDLANGLVPQSYLLRRGDTVRVVRVEQERQERRQAVQAAPAVQADTARFTVDHDFNN